MDEEGFDEEFQEFIRKFELRNIAKQDQDLQEFKLFVDSLTLSQQAEFREALAMIVDAQQTFARLNERLSIFLLLMPPFCIGEDGEVTGKLNSANLSPDVLDLALAAWEQGSELSSDDD